MNKTEIFAICAVAFTLLLVAVFDTTTKKHPITASDFNPYIEERNQGDERATFYDKQTVQNIVRSGCFPIIPRDPNKNIQTVCSDSSTK